MIVCSCNVLTEAQILEALSGENALGVRSPVHVYRCLGCAPQCGRCMTTVRSLLAHAQQACAVGCPACPAHEHPANLNDPAIEPQRRLIAAE